MNYKEFLYRNYYNTQSKILHGETTIKKIEREFEANDFYIGKYLPQNHNAKILEIGCGNGNFVYYLSKRGYTNVTGIDLSEVQVNVGIKLGINGLSVSNIVDYLKGATEFYDCIIARDVIEHLTRQEAFETLCLISASLNPEGSFIMQVPNGQGIYYTSVFYGDYTHEIPYTSQSVKQLFLNSGFSKVQCFPVNPFPGSWKGKLRSVLWRLKICQVKFWKMVETGNPTGIFTSNLIAVGVK